MPKKIRKKQKSRALFRFLVLLLGIVVLAAFALVIKLKELNIVIEKKFNVAKRWNIPSRVYSDAEYLYPGVDVAQRGLVTKLERLSYRQVPQVKGPGDFAVSPTGANPTAIEIYLHDFAYPQERFPGFPIRLELKERIIQRVIDLRSGESLSLVRLEPEQIATLFDEAMEDRTLITLTETPSHLLEAIILIEDERFFKHRGVDPVAIARAAVADVLALKIVQGGSTLTQQLVKNFFLTSQRSLQRKFNEALMALLLEAKYTKAEILEAYLNEIYLGQRGSSSITGVAEAAKYYFAKDIHQITLGEAALLAGLIRGPNEYSPIRNKEKAMARRNLVLKKMLEHRIIDAAAYENALREEVITPQVPVKPAFAPYFVDFLRAQLSDLYPEEILEREGLHIFTTLDTAVQLAAQAAVQTGLARLEKDFGLLQSCIVAISPQHGYVRAMVGGRNYAESQFNRCTQALRQSGSTFKPFVYLTALDATRSQKPFTLGSMLEDTSFELQTPQGKWSPKNYDKKEHGSVSVREALEKSYNIATARLALEVGLEPIIQTARDAGITSTLQPFPSLALGAFEVTPLEMATAYTIFPNLGLQAQALSIIHLVDPEGKILEKKTLKIKRIFDRAPVALVNTALQGVIIRGTAAAAGALGFKGIAAGKTGTTSNYKDAWFVGFTPDLLGLVWVGFDDNTSVQMSGARAALPLWVDFMKQAVGTSWQNFTLPEEIIQVEIDPTTGGLAGSSCPESFSEYFIRGTEPKEDCPHASGRGLPTPTTPSETIPSEEEEF